MSPPGPAPLALFLGFGDNALRFELRVWTARVDRWELIKSELGLAVCAALSEAGITVPIPQQEILVRQARSDEPRGWDQGPIAGRPRRLR